MTIAKSNNPSVLYKVVKKLYMMIKNVISIKIIGFVILIWILLKIDFHQTIQIIKNCRFDLLWWALLCFICSITLKFVRYKNILLQQGIKYSLFNVARVYLAAFYLSIITPGRIGEISKAYFIKNAHHGSLNKLIVGCLVDRSFDIYMLLITALLGCMVVFSLDTVLSQIIILFSIALTMALPFLFIIKKVRETFISIIGWLQQKIYHSVTWCDLLRSSFDELDSLLNRKIFWGGIVTLLSYLLFFKTCHLLSLSINTPLPFIKISVFIAFANILSFLPISFAGLGTREACLVFLFAKENFSSESALAFSTLIFLFTYLLLGIIGFLSIMTLDYEKK